MKALIYKDMTLSWRWSSGIFLLLLAILIGVGITSGIDNTWKIVPAVFAFHTFILLPLTMGYDEESSFEAFALGNVATAKTYVTGKYVFAWIESVLGLITTFVVGAFVARYPGSELIFYVLSGLLIPLLISSIMLPPIFKYGAEKGRGVMAILYILLYLSIFGLREYLPGLYEWLSSLPAFPWLPALIFLGVVLLIHALSFVLSVKWQEKKEF